jgi:hypothetical protein
MLNTVIEAVPRWNFNSMKAWCEANADKQYDENAFINDTNNAENGKVAKIDSVNAAKATDLGDYISDALRGGADSVDEMNLSSLNNKKQKIYDFCVNWENANKRLGQHESSLEKVKNEIIAALEKMNSDISTKMNEAYSSVYGTYVTEDSMGIKQNKPDKTISGTGGNKTGGMKNINVSDSEEAKQQAQNFVDTTTKKDDDGNANPDAEKNKKLGERMASASENYLKYCCTMISTIMTVGLEMYKAYMKILRVHVRKYGGNPDESNKANNTNSNNGSSSFKVGDNTYQVRVGTGSVTEAIDYFKNNNITGTGDMSDDEDKAVQAQLNNYNDSVIWTVKTIDKKFGKTDTTSTVYVKSGGSITKYNMKGAFSLSGNNK